MVPLAPESTVTDSAEVMTGALLGAAGVAPPPVPAPLFELGVVPEAEPPPRPQLASEIKSNNDAIAVLTERCCRFTSSFSRPVEV